MVHLQSAIRGYAVTVVHLSQGGKPPHTVSKQSYNDDVIAQIRVLIQVNTR
jgi:hypothetical protein